MSVPKLRTTVTKEVNQFLIWKLICNDSEVFQEPVNSLMLSLVLTVVFNCCCVSNACLELVVNLLSTNPCQPGEKKKSLIKHSFTSITHCLAEALPTGECFCWLCWCCSEKLCCPVRGKNCHRTYGGCVSYTDAGLWSECCLRFALALSLCRPSCLLWDVLPYLCLTFKLKKIMLPYPCHFMSN